MKEKRVLKTICIDEQSFEKIIQRGGVYVDKTKAIYDIFSKGTYFFISRPRRFGKSLLCSTLDALFSGKKDLFKDTWIHDKWDWSVTHPVIRLDMSKISNASATKETLTEDLLSFLRSVALNYGITTIAEQRPGPFLGALIRELYMRNKMPVVVIIDEYDKPMLDVIDKGPEKFDDIRDVLRAFYTQLKGSSEYLRCVFLTGVYKFSKTSIFSGLNNIVDLTAKSSASQLLGYTEAEIRHYFAEHLAALADKMKISTEELMGVLRKNLNGYTFGIDFATGELSPSVYNPFAVGTTCANQQIERKWFESGSPLSLIALLRRENFLSLQPEMLSDLPLSELSSACSYESITPMGMLFYSGYLTVKAYDPLRERLWLDFPNDEVAVAFSESLLPALIAQSTYETKRIYDVLFDRFYHNKLDGLVAVLNGLLAGIPYHLFISRESYYQTVFYCAFKASRLDTEAEETSRGGRADLIIKVKEHIFVIELKLNQPARVAIAQIREKGYAEKYRRDGRTVMLIGIELASDDRAIAEMVVEAL